jgi:hypothetical protein
MMTNRGERRNVQGAEQDRDWYERDEHALMSPITSLCRGETVMKERHHRDMCGWYYVQR